MNTDLKDHIITAVEIAEKANTSITMWPNQVRALLDRIAVLEERCDSVEERAQTELALRNTEIAKLRAITDEWERKSKNNGLAAAVGLERMQELEGKIIDLRAALIAATNALKSYAYGNQSTELAKTIVARLEEILLW